MTKSTSIPSTTTKQPPASTHAANPMVMPPSDLAKAPAVPAGAPTVAKGEARTLKHLKPQQITLLGALATDFGGSKTWTSDFGSYAPDQATMVQMAQGTGAVFAESTNAA